MKRLLFIPLLLVCLLFPACGEQPRPAEAPGLETVRFIRTVDGDTLKADLDGEEVTVRLIGIDTPESVHSDAEKNTEAGKEASVHTKELLEEGMYLYLEKDVSDTDKYGRLLRYVWLEAPEDSDSEAEIRQKMLNARILSDGYATAVRIGSDDKNYDLFLTLQYEAYESETGLWAQEGALDESGLEELKKREEIMEEAGDYRFIGNKKSQKFHTLFCGNLPGEQNRVYFLTREDALAAGQSPCGSCNP